MPALVPGVQPFASFAGGPYTLSADQESITIGASPAEVVATPWYDMGIGATLARIQWDGTATGTIQGRSSAIRFASGDANHPTDPGTWDTTGYYNPLLETLPTSQSYTLVAGTLAGTGSGATYRARLTTTTSGQTFRVYSAGLGLDSGALIQCQIRIGHVSGTGRAGVSLRAPVGTSAFGGGTFVGFEIDPATGILFAVNGSGTPNGDVAIPDWATVKEHDFMVRLVGGSASVRPATWELWRRPVASASLSSDDPAPYTLLGTWLTIAANDYPAITCGSWWNGGTAVWDYGQIRWYGGTAEWETFSGSGDTAFVRNLRYWQARGWENGTLTAVDMASDLTPPGNPSGPEASAIGASAIGGNCTALASGAAAYYLELLDAGAGDAVIDARWELEPSATFRGLTVPGSFKIRTASASDDGVRGSAATTTSAVAVPAVAGAVALVLDDTTVTPGQTATLTPTITGSVTVTLDGNAMTSGVAANAVTGTGGALIGPSAAAPTITALPAYTTPAIQYTGGAMRIILATTRPSAWTLQKSTDGLTWATDSTQGTNPVNDSALTYSGATVGTSYATNHGWTLGDDTYYRLLPTYSDGSIGPTSNAILVSTRSDYECTVSGTVDEQWSASAVTARLEQAVVYGGQTYTTRTYSATINASGAWTLAGLPRGQVAIFRMPDNQEFRRTVSSSSSATFESLSAP